MGVGSGGPGGGVEAGCGGVSSWWVLGVVGLRGGLLTGGCLPCLPSLFVLVSGGAGRVGGWAEPGEGVAFGESEHHLRASGAVGGDQGSCGG